VIRKLENCLPSADYKKHPCIYGRIRATCGNELRVNFFGESWFYQFSKETTKSVYSIRDDNRHEYKAIPERNKMWKYTTLLRVVVSSSITSSQRMLKCQCMWRKCPRIHNGVKYSEKLVFQIVCCCVLANRKIKNVFRYIVGISLSSINKKPSEVNAERLWTNNFAGSKLS